MVKALIDILTVSPIHTVACAIAVITALSATFAFASGLKMGRYDLTPIIARGTVGRAQVQGPVLAIGKERAARSDERERRDPPDVSINSFVYDPEMGRIVMTVADTIGEGDADR